MKRVLLALLLSSALAAPGAAACPGDCSRDGVVSIDELIAAVGIALGGVPSDRCPDLDEGGDGVVTVDELIAAVAACLNGCDAAVPTRTPTPTRVNHPPSIETPAFYRSFPSFPIALPLRAADPDGDALQFSAAGLSEGAALDAESGVLDWTPTGDDVGPRCFAVTATDSGSPPLSAEAAVALDIAPIDGCTLPDCDAATGCTSSLRPLAENCCAAGPTERIAEPLLDCPQGRELLVGRNRRGFGAVRNCERMKVDHNAQIGAAFQFHIAARCIDADDQVHVHARLEILERHDHLPGLLFDEEDDLFLDIGDDGFAERDDIAIPVIGPGPFYEFEGAEALFSVEVTDADGISVRRDLRVVLTFDKPPDLPELTLIRLADVCGG